MENIKKITTAKLTQMLLDRHTAAKMGVFASIKIDTDARLKKTNNPYPGVRKQSTMNVLLNTEYESGVLNQLKREGKSADEYERGVNTMPLTFGENNHMIGFFEGQPVLQFRPYDNSHPVVAYFTEEGIPVSAKDVEPFLPSKGKAKNQGTEKEIHWRKVYVENILEMTIDGTKYEIENK